MKTALPRVLALTICVAVFLQATASASLSPGSEALMRRIPANVPSIPTSDANLEKKDDILLTPRSIQPEEESNESANTSKGLDDLEDERNNSEAVDDLKDVEHDTLQLESMKGHKGNAKLQSHKFHKLRPTHKKATPHQSVAKGLLSGQGTFFTPGMGACGKKNGFNDMIAAISHLKWDGGSHCGKSATVCRGAHCVQVTMADMCPSCAAGSLDLSPAAFKGLANLDLGVIPITWHFN